MISWQAIYLQLQMGEMHPRTGTCFDLHMVFEEEDMLFVHCFSLLHNILSPPLEILHVLHKINWSILEE